MKTGNVVSIYDHPDFQAPESRHWATEKRLYRDVLARLEQADGPDRALDFDIARLLEVGDEQLDEVLRFTESVSEVEGYLGRVMPHSKWAVQYEPVIDAHIWSDDDDENPEFWSGAWMDENGTPQMDEPPANAAIALTLAMLREAEVLFA